MKIKVLAKHLCLKCHYRWESKHGPEYAICPKCGHLYVKWLNYEEMRRLWEKEK